MGEIVMNRIDDRLIHGQVMIGWLQLRNANAIWIVDDKVANTPMMIDIFSMAAPAGISIHAFTVEEASEKLSHLDEVTKGKMILLAKEPKTFLRLIEKGYTPSDVNYGAMGAKSADVPTIELARNCSLTAEEIEDTEKLHQMGIPVWIQLVPFGGYKPVEWEKVREKAGLG